MLIDVDKAMPSCARGVPDLKQKTGFDVDIIAHLLGQPCVPAALRLAVLQVEHTKSQSIVFTCTGGTHRSVAHAFLLAALFYPEARLAFHSPRVVAAARQALDVHQPA